MHRKFEINLTKIKDGCQSGKKVVAHNSKSDLPLQVVVFYFMSTRIMIICPVCVKNPHLKKKDCRFEGEKKLSNMFFT